jgi:uncharacterized cupredoxin-like copper-binding protein
MKRRTIILFALLCFAALLVGCSQEPTVRQITLVAEDIAWSQNIIEAQVGDTIQLTIRNDGALDHDFVLEEYGIDIPLSPGQQETVTFVVTEAGTLDFICSVPGHLDAGMEGQIIVSE